MPKIVNKKEKKFLIMKSAIHEISRTGFNHANMSSIASRSDLGRTAFYSYFADKQELLDYAVDYLLDLIGTDYLAACDNVFLTSIEKIGFLINRFIRDIITEKDIITVLLEVLLVNNPEFSEQKKKILLRLNEIKKLFAKILRLGIRMDEIRNVDVHNMSHLLLMILISMLYSINTFSDESIKTTVDSCTLLLTGLQRHHNI